MLVLAFDPTGILSARRCQLRYGQVQAGSSGLADGERGQEQRRTTCTPHSRSGRDFNSTGRVRSIRSVLHFLLVCDPQAAKVAPNDPDLRKKLAACEKEVKRLKFEEALATPVRTQHSEQHTRTAVSDTHELGRSVQRV